MVIALIVYADVLIFLNTIVDYLLLLAAAKVLGKSVKTFRMVLASVLGGVSSLYIFLPRQNMFFELLYKLAVAAVLSAVCFKNSGIKAFLKSMGVFFLISCAYGGVMFALWLVFKPYGMIINNSVVYFNISPVVLVVCSILGYFAFCILWRIFSTSAKLALRCNITLFANGKRVDLRAIADTGNSLEDTFGKREVIIADKERVEALFGTADVESNADLKRRYQILPCSTVAGYSVLESFRCDSAEIDCQNKKIRLEKPLVAISKTDLKDDYNAIINPKILT
jgi:stage II sporulation protein GA (sporulation sigma-E factor processing peptidase)